MYFINTFFIYSILGHFFESTIVKLLNANYQSGFLFGYWTPVYGIGVITIVLIYRLLKKHIKNNFIIFILLFILSSIILSTLELIGGYLIELIFNKVFWNYEKFKYNIGKYISLETSIIWGLFSLIIIYLLKPLIDKIIKLIPKWLTYILIILFIIDLVITVLIKL